MNPAKLVVTFKTMLGGSPPAGRSPARRPLPVRQLPPAQAQAVFGANAPFVTEFMMVQCRGFKGMAYRDGEKQWREAYSDLRLPGRVRVLG